jgi:ubiquinone/menaquinone biosynthesis C-methylase UbiE
MKKNWSTEWKKYNKNPFFLPNSTVVNHIKKCLNNNIKGRKIIELGAGKASDLILLAERGAHTYALDYSSESIKAIRYWARKRNVQIKTIQKDARKTQLPDRFFDLAYSIGLVEHFTDPFPIIKEQIRITKDGGFVMIDVPQKYTLYTIAKHIRMKRGTHPFGWETEYSKHELEQLTKKVGQSVWKIYGRNLDIIQKIPEHVRSYFTDLFSKTIENTWIAPYICLNIGLIIQVKKKH